MNRRLKQLLNGFIIACAAAVIMPFQVITAFAGSAKISFSDPSASVGQEFNVSVKISAADGDLGTADIMLSYDPAYIEFMSGSNASGGAGSVRLVGSADSDTTTVFSYNLKFKAIQAGDSAISVASYEVYDSSTQVVDVSKVGGSTVKVAAPSTSSSEAGLSSLKVSPGTLNPAFSSDVTSYTVEVGGDVSKIAVNAVAKDSKAKVLVNGNSNLKVGANSVVCKVTAEDGKTVKSYTIAVNKVEGAAASAQPEGVPAATQGAVIGELKTEIDGAEYSVATSFDPAALPAGYTQSSATYNGTQIMAGSGNGLTLIYLQSGDGNGGFYIYDETSGALSPYVTIDVTAKSIVVLPADSSVVIPSGFAETTIQLNGSYKIKGWIWQSDAEQKYCVVYGMNENGEKGLYRYDIAEKTFQRYFEDPAVENKYDDAEVENLLNEYNALLKDYNTRFIIMIALIVVSLILFFIIVNLLLKHRDHTGGPKDNGRREEAPTPVKRRAMEQNSKSARQPYREAPGGRSRDQEYDRYDQGSSYREREPERKQTLDVYQTRSSADARVHREAPRQEPVRTQSQVPKSTPEYTLRQKELDREERARLARERLEEERRRYSRPDSSSRNSSRQDDDDDFEFMDLNE